MQIRILRPITFTDAGRDRALNVGRDYDVPDALAESWIKAGHAERAAGGFEKARRGRPPKSQHRPLAGDSVAGVDAKQSIVDDPADNDSLGG